MPQAFENIRILDVTHVLAGPFCAYQFALLGADVIKVESPQAPDCARGRGADAALNAAQLGLTYQVQGSNKRALAIDLKSEAGREVVTALVKTCDVFLENYCTGALDALGLGYQDVSAIQPDIIYCSMTGYGGEPPRGAQGAYDNVIQAASGLIAQSGGHKPGASLVDYAAGYSAAFAISAALLNRARHGNGAHISCSMFETALSLMSPEAAGALHPGARRSSQKAGEAGISSYQTRAGRLMLGAFSPRQYRRLGECLQDSDHAVSALTDIKTWDDVWAQADALRARLAEVFLRDTAENWVALLHAHDLPGERVRTLDEAVHDPQLHSRHFFQRVPDRDHCVPVAAYRMPEDGPRITRTAPRIGQHNHEILHELGYSQAQIDALQRQGVLSE